MDTESYDIIVNPSVDQIAVNASAIDSTATVTGTGTVNLQSGNNTIRVEVKAQNGDIRNYQLNVVRQSDAPVVTVPDSGSSSGGNGNTGGVTIGPGQTGGPGGSGNTQTAAPPAGTTAPAPETTAAPASGGDSSGVQVGIAPDGSNWGTGTEQTTAASAPETQPVSIPQTAPQTEAPVQTEAPAPTSTPETQPAQTGGQSLKKGDVNGDGVLSVLDVMIIKKHILGETVLSGAYAAAADVNGDGVVDEKDVSALQNLILAK